MNQDLLAELENMDLEKLRFFREYGKDLLVLRYGNNTVVKPEHMKIVYDMSEDELHDFVGQITGLIHSLLYD